MKKFMFIAVAALAFVACNNNKAAEEAAAEANEAATEVVEEVKAAHAKGQPVFYLDTCS